jgi:transposase
MKIEKPIFGIDISKLTFDVCLLCGDKEKRRKFDNNAKGFRQLSEFLEKHGVPSSHACMEATGRYYERLANYLYDAGHVVSVVNPFQIKGFAASELKRSKTDEIDCGVVARFARSHRPPSWEPQAQEVRELQEAERYLVSLKANLTEESNRLESGLTCQEVKESIERHIKDLELRISELERWMKKHIRQHERLNEHFKLITSIPGIGEVAACTYLGELGYSDRFDCTRQVESFCGLTPKKVQSGTSIHRKERLSKIGNMHLRTALYMPALSSMQHNPLIRAFVERLRQAGKPGKVIVIAVMRKLLRIMFAVVKSGKQFDPKFCSKPKMELQA